MKDQSESVAIYCADPYGAAMWSWFKYGHFDFDDGDSVAEGIGQGRVTENVESARVDDAFRVSPPSTITSAGCGRSRASTSAEPARASEASAASAAELEEPDPDARIRPDEAGRRMAIKPKG